MPRLGQHFLKNKEVIKKIINSLSLQAGGTVLEIGPGEGALTGELLTKNIHLLAIEKDRDLIHHLTRNFKKSNFDLKSGDVRDLLSEVTESIRGEYKLVGNLPYYLTGSLLRDLVDLKNKPTLAIFMIQREVADRLTAQKGEQNLLSAAISYAYESHFLFSVPARDFTPPPKVDSAVISLTPRATPLTPEKDPYFKLIKVIFKQPRKTLVNNLCDGLHLGKNDVSELVKTHHLALNARPQDLSLNNILDLLTSLLFLLK
ncbi:MAG: ribosomal RNA small subunit methyltransferase A [Candidatus Harrisonbacteria bacterium]|nr:ribosomal RNA small subunit methyltransferase A [Candidatus Harrisonbacteria bacterium]